MTLALLRQLLMEVRTNDDDAFKSWLTPGIEELGGDEAAAAIE